MSTTATKDTELETTSVADLLQRVEALEAEQSKQIEKKNKLTIIAWGGNLDQIWPTTILATTAAASGMESSVFFTFWGLFAIVKPGVRITGDNWMQKMMSVMNPGSAQKAKLSHYQFLGAGPAMFKKLADDQNVAKPDELITLGQELGVKLIPCPMSTNPSASMRVHVSSGVAYTLVASRSMPAARSAAALTRSRLPHPPHCAASCPRGRSTAARLANNRSWSGTQWNVAVDKIAWTG